MIKGVTKQQNLAGESRLHSPLKLVYWRSPQRLQKLEGRYKLGSIVKVLRRATWTSYQFLKVKTTPVDDEEGPWPCPNGEKEIADGMGRG